MSEHSAQSKGKGKAISPEDVTETTPLLAGPSNSSLHHDEPIPARRKLLSAFITSLSLCVLVFVGLALLVYSYAPGEVSSEELERALVIEGPGHVDVLNITSSGIWVNVKGRIGFDAGSVIGVNAGEDDGVAQDWWKAVGRWGIHRVGTVRVALNQVEITTAGNERLALVQLPRLRLPLTASPPKEKSQWLMPVSVPLLIRPTSHSAILKFAQESWKAGHISVQANVPRADVFARLVHVVRSNIQMKLDIKIPLLHGLPNPGRGAPLPSFAQLITLQTFNLVSANETLSLRATATAVDLAPRDFSLTTPTIPLIIGLPGIPPVQIAAVDAHPLSLTHPNITIDISGTVLPLPDTAGGLLSKFLMAYLSAMPSPITIMSPMLPGLSLDAEFPAPNPKPQVLKNVTIQDMRIRPMANGTFLASGTISARAVLPLGMDLVVNVTRVLPDVLVFDGEVPEGVSLDFGAPIESPALPDPLPERAFGRLRPHDWLLSECVPTYSEDGEGVAYAVTAVIADVPLQVLPGRQKEFREFVGKVIFGTQGAIAGILGSSDVSVNVKGLPYGGPSHEVPLQALPFTGSVRIGKKGLLTGREALKH